MRQINTLVGKTGNLLRDKSGLPMRAQVPRTKWGGVADGRFRPGQYFQLGKDSQSFWLVDPDGGRFLSKAVNTVRFDQDEIQNSSRIPYAEACQRKYGGQAAWRIAAGRRLTSWGFNTLGCWSDEAVAAAAQPLRLALTPNLDLGMSFAWRKNNDSPAGPQQDFPDVFDPDFDSHIRHAASELCADRCNDQSVIGWFFDNELRWGADWRGPDELLTLFLNLATANPGRVAAIAWLRDRHPDFTQFNSVWRTPATDWQTLAALAPVVPPYQLSLPYLRSAPKEETANRADPHRATFMADCETFAALVAERYFAATSAAIKAVDPHHLLLGCRFAYVPPRAVIEAAGRHTDIISFNCYETDPSDAIETYAATGKPCLIGEFSFRATDSGLPNTNGAGPLVPDQAQRASSFRRYVTAALQHPALIGYHWFEHADQPPQGRFDGENSNFGVVTIKDDPYLELTRAMTSINGEAENLHAAATTPVT